MNQKMRVKIYKWKIIFFFQRNLIGLMEVYNGKLIKTLNKISKQFEEILSKEKN